MTNAFEMKILLNGTQATAEDEAATLRRTTQEKDLAVKRLAMEKKLLVGESFFSRVLPLPYPSSRGTLEAEGATARAGDGKGRPARSKASDD